MTKKKREEAAMKRDSDLLPSPCASPHEGDVGDSDFDPVGALTGVVNILRRERRKCSGAAVAQCLAVVETARRRTSSTVLVTNAQRPFQKIASVRS